MSDEYIQSCNGDMQKALDGLRRELTGVRTGRATPSLIENLQVHVVSYESTMPLNQLGGITAPDARLLVVNPWDKGTLKDIERAIASSDLGLNPMSDGTILRIPIPSLTTERRLALVKLVKKASEDCKVRVRAIRKEYIDLFKQMNDDHELTDDQFDKLKDKVQESTDAHVKKVDDIAGAKEKEVMDV